MKFLLDSNFLLIPGKFKVDVFSELTKFGKPEFYTLDLVLKELKRLKGGKLAFEMIKKNKVKILKAKGLNTDEALESFARKDFVICTQDKGLIKRLKERRAKVITLRQRKYLVET
jgi:hypothetical protein